MDSQNGHLLYFILVLHLNFMQVQHDSLLHSKSKVTFSVSNRYSRLLLIDKLFCFLFVCSDDEQTNLNEMLNNTQN